MTESGGNEVSTAIEMLLDLRNSQTQEDAAYQAAFANEGGRKAQYVVDDLARREARGEFLTSDLAYLCIGGADGSEPLSVLRSTGISRAVMLEISDAGAEAARRAAQELLAATGKELVVLQGDVGQRLSDAVDQLGSWHGEQLVSGLVLSAQAVLHELPARSPNFDLHEFLGTAFGGVNWDACAFYSREPCEPRGWPERVSIRIPGVLGARLAQAAVYVGQVLRIDGGVTALASEWVSMPSVLAIETLHKLIRGDGIQRIRYELGEQLTSVRPTDIQRHLQHFLPGMRVDVDYVLTAGFKSALRDQGVEFVDTETVPLPYPQTHAEIVGVRASVGTQRAMRIDDQASRVWAEAHGEPARFADRFGGYVDGPKLEHWFGQFAASERGLIDRLLEHFIFIDSHEMKLLLTKLCDVIRRELGERFDDAVFVPLGSVARSGEFVAYQFRSVAGLPIEMFMHGDDPALASMASRPVVLLDDLLASGHQALAETRRLEDLLNSHTGGIMLATAVSCATGRSLLEERTDLKLCAGLELGRDAEPFSSKSAAFPNDDERVAARAVLQRYGERLAPTAPLGYAGTGLLLGFEHSTPDNSLPIFWSKQDGWSPLLSLGGSTRTMSK